MTRLSAGELRRGCDPRTLSFASTDELEPETGPFGQGRAMEALEFATRMRHPGYNVFVTTVPGGDTLKTVRRFLEQIAAKAPAPRDQVHVNDFDDLKRPRALSLPAGTGPAFAEAMGRFVEDLGAMLKGVFQSDEYRSQRRAVDEALEKRTREAFEEVHRHAETVGARILHTEDGIEIAAVRGDEVLDEDELRRLSPAERAKIDEGLREVQHRLEEVFHALPRWEKEHEEHLDQLNRQFADYVVSHLLGPLRKAFGAAPDVARHLDRVAADVLAHLSLFVADLAEDGEDGLARLLGLSRPGGQTEARARYGVNVLTNHDPKKGAPVIVEDHPTHANLVGRIEHRAELGALVADVSLVRAGSLHRANGGFLLIDAERLLSHSLSWPALKRVIERGSICIETQSDFLNLSSIVTLEPEPVPLTAKIVLFGEFWLHALMSFEDPDFSASFKVMADFAEDVPRDEHSERTFARVLAGIAKGSGTLALDRNAVARLVEEASRLAGDAAKLSVETGTIADLVREADHCAREDKADIIRVQHVRKAVAAATRRADLVREEVQERVLRGIRLIDTDGGKVGQINGLSVYLYPHIAFGTPTRISARIRPASGGQVLDIERQVNLGGPLHSKGVLILSSYLTSHYATGHPLHFGATLTFEQSYGRTDGDSASAAELFTLISAIAEVPLWQGIAVTGSVNQYGEIQAIGGVNEKIEGFFDICAARGLSGRQGVLIPAANRVHLMLKDDVVEAVAAGKFSVYTMETIDQGLEILTGLKAGARSGRGRFPRESVNGRVEARLLALSLAARGLKVPPKKSRWSIF